MSDISIRVVSSLKEVNPKIWDSLDHGISPFQRHGFLLALEESGSVGAESGWLPSYLLVERDDEVLGACAAYIKTDSYGEYIFDWAWARAAPQFGCAYYPKLVVSAPFTPATGKRLLIAPGQDEQQVCTALIAGIAELVRQYDLSGAHILFCTDEEAAQLESAGLARRASYQFHWNNRDYESFDDFLAALKSRKRKQIRKERERALAAVDSIEFVAAKDFDDADFLAIDRFYRSTVHEHGGFDYLRPGFFRKAAEYLPETMYFARAKQGGKVIAGALFFETDEALYGRYWGADQHCEFLHFEVAYYAGIERCIQRGLRLFEAGAQGEHKLLRGFEPALTHSAHLMANPRFDSAIRGFLREEKAGVEHRMGELAGFGPYKEEV